MSFENPYKKYESLFEKWPGVRACVVRKEHGMKVGGYHYTPDGHKRTDFLTAIAAIFWAVMIGLCYRAKLDFIWPHAEAWTVAAVVFWAGLAALSYTWILSFSLKPTVVMLSPSHIQIGQKVYDARVQHKFSMDIHRKAKEEADAELRAQQRGNRSHVRHFKYYRKAFHIYFEYLGQRILVTDISDEETAEKFLRALVAVDKIMYSEKTVFAANINTEDAANDTDIRQEEYFGKRPALD